MATSKTLYNSPTLDCVLELLYRSLGVKLDPDFVQYQLDTTNAILTITPLAQAADGRQGIYQSSVVFEYDKVDLASVLPQDIVYGETYPIDYDRLKLYLKSSYDYLVEDGEFSIVGDSTNTPLTAGATIGVDPDPVTGKIALQATPGAGRWLQGSQFPITITAPGALDSARLIQLTGDAPNGTSGAAYSYQYQVQGGQSPYTWEIISGTSPAPINSQTGLMQSDALTTSGSLSWTVRVTDSQGRVKELTDSCTVSVAALVFSDVTDPVVSYATAFSYPLAIEGGVPPYVAAVDSADPSVMRGLSLTSDGVLSGIPAVAGQQVPLKVTDQEGTVIRHTFTLTPASRTAAQVSQRLFANLVAWYGFDDGDYSIGNTVVDYHQNLNLSVADAGLSSVLGIDGGSVDIDNGSISGSYQSLIFSGNFSGFGYTTTSRNISGGALVGQGDGASGWLLDVTSDGNKNFRFTAVENGESAIVTFDDSQLGAGPYHQLAFSRDGAYVDLFGDGTRATSMGIGGALTASALPFTFGVRSDGMAGTKYHGDLDSWAFFNDVLYPDDLAYLAALPYTGGYDKLKADALSQSLTLVTINGVAPSYVVNRPFNVSYPIQGPVGATYSQLRLIAGQLPAGVSATINAGQIVVSGTPTAIGTFNYAFAVTADNGQVGFLIDVVDVLEKFDLINLPLTGADGSTDFTDLAGQVWVADGGATISTDVGAGGALKLDGATQRLTTVIDATFAQKMLDGYQLDLNFFPQRNKAYLLNLRPIGLMPIAVGVDGGTGNPGDSEGLLPYFGWYDTQWRVARGDSPLTVSSWNALKFVKLPGRRFKIFVNQLIVADVVLDTDGESDVAPDGTGLLVIGERWDDTLSYPFTQGYLNHLLLSTEVLYDTLSITGTLPNVDANAAYNESLTLLGGSGVYSNFTLISGALPNGITASVVGRTVVFSGTPTTAGTFTFTFSVDSDDGQTASNTQTVVITQINPLVISGDVGGGNVGVPSTYTYGVSGGTGPYTFDLVNPPAGWSVPDPSQPTIDYTAPTAGTITWTFRVTDSLGATAEYTDSADFTALPPLALSGSFADALIGEPYVLNKNITGGTGTYSNLQIVSGSLAGTGLSLTLNGTSVELSGTPTGPAQRLHFTFSVDSGDGQTIQSVESPYVHSSYWRVLKQAPDIAHVFDFNDLTSLFQDVAATIPVTAPGQTVRAIRDQISGGYATNATGVQVLWDAARNAYYLNTSFSLPFGMTADATFVGNGDRSIIHVANMAGANIEVPSRLFGSPMGNGEEFGLGNVDDGAGGYAYSLYQHGQGYGTTGVSGKASGFQLRAGTKQANALKCYSNGVVFSSGTSLSANITAPTYNVGDSTCPVYSAMVINRQLSGSEIAFAYANPLTDQPTLALSNNFASATVGQSYSSDLAITGGNGIFQNPRVVSGSLSGTGLSLSVVGSNLRLSGTPTGSSQTLTLTIAVDSEDGQSVSSVQSLVIVSSLPSYIASQLRFAGTNGSNTFTDDVASNVWNASAATLSTAKQLFVNPTGYFNGASSVQEVTAIDGIRTGDFTIQMYVSFENIAANGNQAFLDLNNGQGSDFTLFMYKPTQTIYFTGSAGENVLSSGATTIAESEHTHIALVRKGGVLNLYIEGHLSGSVAYAQDMGPILYPRLGYGNYGGVFRYLNGYIGQFQIAKTALYDGDFTPTLWSTTDKNSNISLFSNNAVAQDSTNTTTWKCVRGAEAKSSGKWYFEVDQLTGIGTAGNISHAVGVANASAPLNGYPGTDANSWAHLGDGYKAHSGYTAYGYGWSLDNRFMVAVDIDAGKIWFGVDGAWFESGDPADGLNPAFTGVGGTLFPIAGLKNNDSLRFAMQLAYKPPIGFTPWLPTVFESQS